ncbi:hypothetical protein EVG20_g1885 [Dentipellis fragilis]|uniref:Uncharacterized protein n=1 Tax=Dentipellis fragilis TaxID=205917 RepID=A0A4Y9ZCH7_9AGAM|nr:hypothetical protein EVG20_g1885 [Dentipellis fragilis]
MKLFRRSRTALTSLGAFLGAPISVLIFVRLSSGGVRCIIVSHACHAGGQHGIQVLGSSIQSTRPGHTSLTSDAEALMSSTRLASLRTPLPLWIPLLRKLESVHAEYKCNYGISRLEKTSPSPSTYSPAPIMPLALDQAILGALFVEAVMYGICMTMGSVTTVVFLKADSQGALTHKRLLLVLLLMLLLATTHIILSFIRVFIGFISKLDLPGGPSAYFVTISNNVLLAKDGLFIVQTILGDSVNVWRCYVVCGQKKRIVAAPLVTLIAGIVCSCMIEYTLAHATSGNIFSAPSRWIKAFHVLMLITIVYCNAAIVWKIWRVGNFKHGGNKLFPVIIVIIETGALYTSNLIAFLVVYLNSSNGQYIALDLITPLVPVVFCLIILQIKYLQANDSKYYARTLDTTGPAISLATIRQTLHRQKRPNNAATTLSGFRVQPLEVNITVDATDFYSEQDVTEQQKSPLDHLDPRSVHMS